MNSPYASCRLCPRKCGVNREAGQRGLCGETSALRLAYAGIHFGEEPPITGGNGSGTIFVSGCNLGCVFCQNHQISRHNNSSPALGRETDENEFAGICLALQEKGAENINIVTGSHAAPALARGIETARTKGLLIPILWNSSGYDGLQSLEILKDLIDMYLPDLKTLDSSVAEKFFAPDYPEHAAAAILWMMKTRPPRPDISNRVMIRHLVLPGFMENTRLVLRCFSQNFVRGKRGSKEPRALLSLMTQYTPVNISGAGKNIPGNFLSEDEYDEVILMLDEFGINDGFCQELVTGSDWLPDFTRSNPFSSGLSVPVWHWRT